MSFQTLLCQAKYALLVTVIFFEIICHKESVINLSSTKFAFCHILFFMITISQQSVLPKSVLTLLALLV